MKSDRWQRIETIYDAARRLSGEKQRDLVKRACVDDSDLAREILSLLEADREAGDFLSNAAFRARNRARHHHVSIADADANPAPPAASGISAADEILDNIHRLPECYREPLLLRLVLQLTGAEIAQRTGLTEGSVRVNLHRGRRLLRRRLRHWQ